MSDEMFPRTNYDAAFTVDVEDYYHVTAFEHRISREDWHDYESRVVVSTQRILELLARHEVRGTFFILGWIAKHFPRLVREIHQAGHEIGSHSFWHRRIYHQTPAEFRADLRHSRDVLADTIGAPITCFRAPTFSVTPRSRWALEILVEEGFTVDSSIFPTRHDRYGMPDSRHDIHQLETPAGPLWEYPLTVAHLGPFRLPVAGGGYFRLYPLELTKRCLRRFARRVSHPFMFYIHPWELDPHQPRLRVASRLTRFRHYVNLHSTEEKLDRLLATFRFGPMRDVLGGHVTSPTLPLVPAHSPLY